MALNPGAPMPSSLVSNTQGRSSSTLRLQLLSSITWSLPPTKSWSWRAAADCLMSLTNPLRFIIGQNHSSLDGMKLPQLGAGIIYIIGRGGERKEREEGISSSFFFFFFFFFFYFLFFFSSFLLLLPLPLPLPLLLLLLLLLPLLLLLLLLPSSYCVVFVI